MVGDNAVADGAGAAAVGLTGLPVDVQENTQGAARRTRAGAPPIGRLPRCPPVRDAAASHPHPEESDDLVPLQGLLFDVDNTLFDYSASEEVGLLAHLRAQGLLDRFPDPAAALALWRAVMDAQYARFLNGELTFGEQRRERTRRFLLRLGQDASAMSDHEASAWFAGYTVHREAAWAAFPDAEPALRKLAPDHRLGIVSNSSIDHQRRKLDSIGLLTYFGDRLICSDQHGEAKPVPSIFLAGCASLGLQPHEVAYVGDNYTLDAEGAHDAGLRAYWLDRANAGHGRLTRHGIRVIHSLDELPTALSD
jgi:putative hydrolase of the HAD superfamily